MSIGSRDKVRGNLGAASIGGVSRDANGKALCLFSSGVDTCDSNKAKVLAIHRALSWINGDGFGLLEMVNFIFDSRQLLSLMVSLSIKFMPRGSNSLADSLEKAGSSSQVERLEWGDL
ncbi:hypothetical protein Q3G72_024297 [Acer saccharum]|nr:hypothetical protein Q3G72_024297 [Acer saccharum]